MKNTSKNKGIRLDLYVKDVDGNIYDIEMQASDEKDIELRSRYYHSEMDTYVLKQGREYSELQKSIVIFICMKDYFQTSNPTDDFTKNIEDKVDKNRQDTEWRGNFVHLSMKFEEKYQEGLERGRADTIVNMGREFGLSDEDIVKRIMKEAEVDEKTAREYLEIQN